MKFLYLTCFCYLALLQGSFAQSGLQLPPEQKGFPLEKSDNGAKKFEISPRYSLNGTIKPIHYELKLQILLDDDPDQGDQYTAPGEVSITFQPLETANKIVFHSNLPVIDKDSIVVTNINAATPINVVSFDNETGVDVHFVTVEIDEELTVGDIYVIFMKFVSPISRDRLDGLFLTTYIDPDTNEERRAVSTQGESHNTRQSFPCFDEPDLKATFNVTVIRKANYTTSLTNTDRIGSVEDSERPGWWIDTFREIVPMSTYLFALHVSDYAFAEANETIFPGKPVRTYAPKHIIEAGGGDYSAEIAAKLLYFFDDYYGFLYPLNKMDSIASPEFDAGAMENWGLNVYREARLIYYPDEQTEATRNSVTSIIAHELAHQNFGNLVTCKAWSQIWLNEGFATYVSYHGVANVAPEFQQEEWILNDAYQYSMVVDAGPTSHPLQQLDLKTPTDFDTIWTTITYDKGASINRMTEKFLTRDIYHYGLSQYLRNMAYKGAESDNLFEILNGIAHEYEVLPADLTIKQILDTWTLQKGHPLVRVNTISANSISISQEKYGSNVENPTSLWYVPVTMVTEEKPMLEDNIPGIWLSNTQNNLTVSELDTSKWIMINQDATGYYRVLYDDHLTSLILSQLESNASVISPLSRSQLLDDYFNLAFLELGKIDDALHLTRYLEQEDHFTVWDVVFVQLRKAYNLIGGTEFAYVLKDYLLPKVNAAALKVGVKYSAEEHIGMREIFRAKLLDWACSLGSKECEDYAQELFQEWATTGQKSMSRDTEAVLTCAIVASGDNDTFGFILHRYSNAGSSTKGVLLNALACSSDEDLVKTLLDHLVTGNAEIKGADATTILQRLAMNPTTRPLVISFLEEEIESIIRVVGAGEPKPIADIVRTLSGYLSSKEELERIASFVQKNIVELVPISDNLINSQSIIQANIDWMDKFGNRIIEVLLDEQQTTTESSIPTTSTASPPTTISADTTTTTTGTTTSTDTTSTTTQKSSADKISQLLSFLILAILSTFLKVTM